MNSPKILLLALSSATLAFTSCSSEPSDWRPENKVSLDMVAPGTRETDNFDQHTEHAPNQAKGGAITKPVSSAMEVQGNHGPGKHSAESAISANAEGGPQQGGPHGAGKSTLADTTAEGHQVQR